MAAAVLGAIIHVLLAAFATPTIIAATLPLNTFASSVTCVGARALFATYTHPPLVALACPILLAFAMAGTSCGACL